MKSQIVKVRTPRKYSEAFKRDIVAQYERGKFSVKQLCKLHTLVEGMIYRWIYKYSTFNEKTSMVVEMKTSSSEKLKVMEKRNQELERIVGQKQILIDYLEKLIAVASDGLKVDIKKNFDTPPSSGSGNTLKH